MTTAEQSAPQVSLGDTTPSTVAEGSNPSPPYSTDEDLLDEEGR